MVDRLDSSAPATPVSSEDARLQLGTLILSSQPLTETLHVVARLAASTIPGVDEVCITLIDVASNTHTVAFSGSLAATFDERQYEPGFGPCLAAAQSGGVVRVDDTTTHTSHPAFAALARRSGVRSALGMGLAMPAGVQGAMGLYRTSSDGPISSETQSSAASFVTEAGATLADASLIDGLQRRIVQLNNAMSSREVIDQAKGIIMLLGRCGADEAFQLLAEQSQRTNRKLRDVAAGIVTEATRGELVDVPRLTTGVMRLT